MRKINASKIEIKESNVLDQWANTFIEVKSWLNKLQAKKHSAYYFYLFCYSVQLSPPELLNLKDDPKSTEAEKLLDTFMAEDVGVTRSAKFNISIAVRSFFKHNYKDLASAAGAMGYEKVKPYWKPSKKDLRKLYRHCTNPRDRSILTNICSSAIAKETLSNFKWKHLEEDWQEQEIPHLSFPPELIKGHGRGKYAGVRQETFLTPEGKRDLIEYKEWMEQKLGRLFNKEENVYWTLHRPYKPFDYKGIANIFQSLQHSTGIQFSPHDARRWVETALEDVRMSSNWARKIRGRKLKGEEAPYSRPAIRQLREKYREAVPLLEFTIEKAISQTEEAIAKAQAQEALKKLPRHEREAFLNSMLNGLPLHLRKVVSTDHNVMKLLKQDVTKATKKETEDCQKLIDPEELEPYLKEGWKYVGQVNGKIIVEK